MDLPLRRLHQQDRFRNHTKSWARIHYEFLKGSVGERLCHSSLRRTAWSVPGQGSHRLVPGLTAGSAQTKRGMAVVGLRTATFPGGAWAPPAPARLTAQGAI